MCGGVSEVAGTNHDCGIQQIGVGFLRLFEKRQEPVELSHLRFFNQRELFDFGRVFAVVGYLVVAGSSETVQLGVANLG